MALQGGLQLFQGRQTRRIGQGVSGGKIFTLP